MINMPSLILAKGTQANVLTLSFDYTSNYSYQVFKIGNRSQSGQTINCTVEVTSVNSGDYATISVGVYTYDYSGSSSSLDHSAQISNGQSTTFNLTDDNYYSPEYLIEVALIATPSSGAHPDDSATVKITVNSATIDTVPSPDNKTVTIS